jgi:hypothetical protein
MTGPASPWVREKNRIPGVGSPRMPDPRTLVGRKARPWVCSHFEGEAHGPDPGRGLLSMGSPFRWGLPFDGVSVDGVSLRCGLHGRQPIALQLNKPQSFGHRTRSAESSGLYLARPRPRTAKCRA